VGRKNLLPPVSHLPGKFQFREFSGISRFLEKNFKEKKGQLNFLGNLLKNISPLQVAKM